MVSVAGTYLKVRRFIEQFRYRREMIDLDEDGDLNSDLDEQSYYLDESVGVGASVQLFD